MKPHDIWKNELIELKEELEKLVSSKAIDTSNKNTTKLKLKSKK